MLHPRRIPFHHCAPLLQGHPPHHVIISDLSYWSESELENYKWAQNQVLLLDTSYSMLPNPDTLLSMKSDNISPSINTPPNGHGSMPSSLSACSSFWPLLSTMLTPPAPDSPYAVSSFLDSTSGSPKTEFSRKLTLPISNPNEALLCQPHPMPPLWNSKIETFFSTQLFCSNLLVNPKFD